jgi:hypothetical protein
VMGKVADHASPSSGDGVVNLCGVRRRIGVANCDYARQNGTIHSSCRGHALSRLSGPLPAVPPNSSKNVGAYSYARFLKLKGSDHRTDSTYGSTNRPLMDPPTEKPSLGLADHKEPSMRILCNLPTVRTKSCSSFF